MTETAAQAYAREAFARNPEWDGSTPPHIYTNEELVDCLLQVYARSNRYINARGLFDRQAELRAELMRRIADLELSAARYLFIRNCDRFQSHKIMDGGRVAMMVGNWREDLDRAVDRRRAEVQASLSGSV